MSGNRVKVGVKVRPLVPHEEEGGAEGVVSKERDGIIRVSVPLKNNRFEYDWAFGPSDLADEVYSQTCKPLVKNFFEGYNATVFAYGQTGSGKTYTMGNDGKDNSEGIIPRAVKDIFQNCRELEENNKYTLTFSYMEIYKEDCFDLLSQDRKKCDIRELVNGDTVVEGLTQEKIHSEKEVQQLLSKVSHMRSTAKTAMNASSSRSHAICTFTLTSYKDEVVSEADNATTTVKTKSQFHMVDLAGSERAKKTMASGEVFAEGVNINKGLLALGNVIVALSSGNAGHIPYRDSKITRILKDSLGGNSKTVMLACVSPADTNFEETLNTLRFSSRASCIVNSVSVNRDYSSDASSISSAQLIQEICVLREELKQAKQNAEEFKYDDRDSAQKCDKIVTESFAKLAAFTRSILIKCLEDDVEVDDEEVEHARGIIKALKEELGICIHEEENDEGLSLDFLPPIMKLVDDFDNLEKQVLGASRDSIESEHSDQSGDYVEASGSGGSLEEGTGASPDIMSNQSLEEMQSKQIEVNYMIEMTEQCKKTISALRQEVQRLEDEKSSINRLTSKSTGGKQNKQESEKNIQLLKEKAKLLENKQKELRRKEIEYAKLMQQKEKASKEVKLLTNELNSAKRQRVELIKKQKEESKMHLEEKKKLVKAENMHRKKELEAQDKALKIQRELANKDKFMTEKLADKDREIKRLKVLTQKKENVKQQRAQAPSNKISGGFPSSSGIGLKKPFGARPEELSHARISELQSWIEKEVEMQSSRNYLQEEIQYQMEQRSKDVRKLQTLKQQCEASSSESLEEEIKNVDEDLRARSRSIAKAQGQLADLGIVVEKRRFAKITSLKEAKVLMSGMFQKLSYDKLMEQRSLEARISSQEDEIRQLKESLQRMESAGPSGSSRRRKSVSTEPSVLSEVVEAPTEGVKKNRIQLKPSLPDFSKKVKTTKKFNNKKSVANDSDEEIDFVFEESFMTDDDSDDEDYIPENEITKSRKRTSGESNASSERGKKRCKGSDASSNSIDKENIVPEEPYSQYTVAKLKSFLADRSLPVSGRKDELIQRLISHGN